MKQKQEDKKGGKNIKDRTHVRPNYTSKLQTATLREELKKEKSTLETDKRVKKETKELLYFVLNFKTLYQLCRLHRVDRKDYCGDR
jgi:hypothetical protein